MLNVSDPRLKRLYDYWVEKKGARRMPARADLDPLDMIYVLGDLMLVEVIDEAVPRFRIRLHGSNLAARAGYDLTGKILDELPHNEFRSIVKEAWTEVVATAEPRHCLQDAVLDGRLYRYESIVLPLSPDGERVNMELVGLVHLSTAGSLDER